MLRSDITSQISGLTHHMQNIHWGLPVTRLVRSMETHLFSRARVHWAVFRKVLSEDHGKLVESGNWDTVTEYIMVTMTLVWEENVHNSPRYGCFRLHAMALRKVTCFRSEYRVIQLYSYREWGWWLTTGQMPTISKT